MKKCLYDLSLAEVKTELESLVEKMPRYRAEQVFGFMNDYKTFDEMTNSCRVRCRTESSLLQ